MHVIKVHFTGKKKHIYHQENWNRKLAERRTGKKMRLACPCVFINTVSSALVSKTIIKMTPFSLSE